MPEKNKQVLQKPKQTPKALAIPSNLTTPANNLEAKPETEIGTKPLKEINLFFSIKAQSMDKEELETHEDNSCSMPKEE
ncbi:hypothetical protein G9A89_019872 [Geosiphon pyriformis]|nr:hypothetical protein G9A89_019872 [Geosiphon pyriformis]